MADNNIGTLFHFTRNYSTLKQILKEGFRFTYCKESFLDSSLGIPMVSFCDIPLSRTDQHKKDYGIYVVGLDKEKLLSNEDIVNLNPVIYCHSANLAENLGSYKKTEVLGEDDSTGSVQRSADVGASSGRIENDGIEPGGEKHLSNSILGFTKPYAGVGKKGRRVVFYNEREWRFVIPEGESIGERPCRWLTEREYEQWRGDPSKPKKLLPATLPIGIEYITHLIVDQETTIPSLIDHIWGGRTSFRPACRPERETGVDIPNNLLSEN